MRKDHARRRVRPARAVALAVAFASPVMLGFNPASAQSLFEALFGGGFRSAPPRLYAPPPNPIPEFGNERRRATPKHIKREAARVIPREAYTTPAPYVAPEVMPGPLGRFLRDPSLRRGDIVATAEGLMVFRGNSGSRHSEKDFVPVARAGSLIASRTRTEVAKLDKAVKLGRDSRVTIVAETGPPIVAQDDGRRLR